MDGKISKIENLTSKLQKMESRFNSFDRKVAELYDKVRIIDSKSETRRLELERAKRENKRIKNKIYGVENKQKSFF